jgi:ribonuclease Z
MDSSPTFRVTFVGSGNTWCDGGRANQAILVETAAQRMLVDCGPTTTLSAKRLGVDLHDLDAIFITHQHGDHTFGLPQLLLEMQFGAWRDRALPVFVPPAAAGFIDAQLALAYPDVHARGLDFDLQERVLAPGEPAVELGDCRVEAFAMSHSVPASGYRFTSGDKILAISGDTVPCDGLFALARGADLLVTECSFAQPIPNVPHTSLEELIAIRERLACARVCVVHTDGSLDTAPFEAPRDGEVYAL